MVRTRVKVCCISSVEEAAIAVSAGADALGLVGPMPSGPGVVDDQRAAEIAATVPPPAMAVLLTSETSADGILSHVGAVGAPAVQIVNEVGTDVHQVLAHRAPGLRRIQVLHVEGPEAVDRALAYEGESAPHALLLESGRPSAPVPELGGTGRTHNWEVSAALVAASALPVFLAGGLHPGNIAEAVEVVRPYGVDVCSGLRSNGHLDPDKLAAFFGQMPSPDGLG